MGASYKNFEKGIALIPKASSGNTLKGDIELLSTDNKVRYYDGTTNQVLVTEEKQATLENKDLVADSVFFIDEADDTIELNIDLSNGTTSTKTTLNFIQTDDRVLTFPDITDTVVTLTATQTLTNKTIDAGILDDCTANTITGITGGTFLLQSATDEDLSIQAQGTGIVLIEGLEIVGNSILSSLNENLTLEAQGTGSLLLAQNGTDVVQIDAGIISVLNQGEIRLYEDIGSGSDYIGLQSPTDVSTTYTITLPEDPPAASTALTFDGTNYVWGIAGGFQMNINLAIATGGTIDNSDSAGMQVWEIAGDSEAKTLSTTPFANSAVDGAVIRLIGRSDTNTVTLLNNDASGGCWLNGNATLGLGNVLELQYLESVDRFVETFRNF